MFSVLQLWLDTPQIVLIRDNYTQNVGMDSRWSCVFGRGCVARCICLYIVSKWHFVKRSQHCKFHPAPGLAANNQSEFVRHPRGCRRVWGVRPFNHPVPVRHPWLDSRRQVRAANAIGICAISLVPLSEEETATDATVLLHYYTAKGAK